MDENLYTLVSTGLLALIALLLLLLIARVARVERALKDRETAPTEGPAVDGAIAAATAAPIETSPQPPGEPEGADEPFEQDGRWWYRRGTELLVYDEQAEAWVEPAAAAAPEPEPELHPLDEARGWDREPAVVAPTPEPDVPYEPEVVTPTEEPVSPPESITEASEVTETTPEAGAGSHWKCPACGVINGSTATSCRMCFAARP